MTLAELATSIDHQHLGAVIRSVAYRSGSLPEYTPAFAAVELYPPARSGAGRCNLSTSTQHSTLADLPFSSRPWQRALRFARCIHLGCSVVGITIRNGRVVAITSNDGSGKPPR